MPDATERPASNRKPHDRRSASNRTPWTSRAVSGHAGNPSRLNGPDPNAPLPIGAATVRRITTNGSTGLRPIESCGERSTHPRGKNEAGCPAVGAATF
eukprot:9469616-Pyramimonas_sp.AAC.1